MHLAPYVRCSKLKMVSEGSKLKIVSEGFDSGNTRSTKIPKIDGKSDSWEIGSKVEHGPIYVFQNAFQKGILKLLQFIIDRLHSVSTTKDHIS